MKLNPEKAVRQLKLLKKQSREMRLAAESWKNNYEILISTMMSARTRDEVTIPVAENLFRKYPSVEKLSKAKINEIEKIINPVNFYKTKSKNIINCARKIVEKHHSKIPKDFEKLIKLPGVGRKTANVFLSEIGKDEIGVDTHVSYISQKLVWTKNKKPDKIENDLKNLFPMKYWRKINPVLVRFGKTYTSKNEKNKILEKINNLNE